MKNRKASYQYGGRFTSRSEWIHPERLGSSYELIVVTEGRVWIEEEGVEYDLSPGQTLLLEPNKRHRGVRPTSERVSFYWIHFEDFDFEACECLQKCMTLTDSYAVTLLCRQLLYYHQAGHEGQVLDALLYVLLAELEDQARRARGDMSRLADQIREWIRINSDRELKVADVSARFGYNVDYLSRLYRKCYGHGLKTEIDEMKMREIKKLLLESDLTLEQICSRTGMSDYKLFLKFFKYHEGITPSEFRRLYSMVHTNNR